MRDGGQGLSAACSSSDVCSYSSVCCNWPSKRQYKRVELRWAAHMCRSCVRICKQVQRRAFTCAATTTLLRPFYVHTGFISCAALFRAVQAHQNAPSRALLWGGASINSPEEDMPFATRLPKVEVLAAAGVLCDQQANETRKTARAPNTEQKTERHLFLVLPAEHTVDLKKDYIDSYGWPLVPPSPPLNKRRGIESIP